MMSDTSQSFRVLAILADADQEAFLASATAVHYAAEGVEIAVISPNPAHADADQAVCELVAHIRRRRPDVVITSGPWDGDSDVDRMAISQLATAAVVRAPDPRYGHTCRSRGAHTVSKLYYTAAASPISTRIEADTYYRAFSTVSGGLSTETDLFDGLRRSAIPLALAG
jgi:LmbE family N-acetylglucosaminyl deacetylase